MDRQIAGWVDAWMSGWMDWTDGWKADNKGGKQTEVWLGGGLIVQWMEVWIYA
jgi:hypothetical protein